MTLSVNQQVVTGLGPLPIENYYTPKLPTPATPACLSEADQAPWTNRVPAHEPWPRTLEGNTLGANSENNESEYNTNHNPQFVDDGGGVGSKSINRVEGTTTLPRNQFWRR